MVEQQQQQLQSVNYQQLISEVLEYWFSKDWDRFTGVPNDLLPKWFGMQFVNGKIQGIDKTESQKIDQFIDRKFKIFVEAAGKKQLNIQEELSQTSQGKLALIILLDQFTRNIYRGTKEVFQFDDQALQISKEIVKNQEEYNKYTVYEKNFVLLPMCHSEELENISKFTELIEELPNTQGLTEQTLSFLKNATVRFAKIHLDAIVRFKRYPHRNKILGRENTADENEYLAKENVLNV